MAVDLVQDPLLPLTCEHGHLPSMGRRQQITAPDRTYLNIFHRGRHVRRGERPSRPAAAGARGTSTGGDLTQWRACPRMKPLNPPASRASSRACSPRATRCTSATTSARWSSGCGLQETPRRLLLRRRPARADGRARPGACCASGPASPRRSTSPAASTPRGPTLFVQSHVAEHTELAWVLVLHHRLRRGRPDDAVQGQVRPKGAEGTNVGLFTYPVLRPPTSCCTTPTVVPVGEDQRQHLELTRDLAGRFNSRFGETFVVPEPHIVKATRQDPRPAGADRQDEQVGAQPTSGLIDLLDDPQGHRRRRSARPSPTPSARSASTRSTSPASPTCCRIHSALSGRPVAELEERLRGQGLRRPQEGRRRGRRRDGHAVPRPHPRAAGRPGRARPHPRRRRRRGPATVAGAPWRASTTASAFLPGVSAMRLGRSVPTIGVSIADPGPLRRGAAALAGVLRRPPGRRRSPRTSPCCRRPRCRLEDARRGPRPPGVRGQGGRAVPDDPARHRHLPAGLAGGLRAGRRGPRRVRAAGAARSAAARCTATWPSTTTRT